MYHSTGWYVVDKPKLFITNYHPSSRNATEVYALPPEKKGNLCQIALFSKTNRNFEPDRMRDPR